MGTSRTIQDLKSTDQDFSEFMKGLEKSIEEASAKYIGEFDAAIQTFYLDTNGDGVQLEGRSHSDYQLETEFTMKNIVDVITKTSNEIFGTQDKDEEKKEIILAVQNYEEMAVKVAIDFISNALVSLSWKASAGYLQDIQHVSVGPGLTMHLMVVNRVYEGRGIIEHKKVFQNFIYYKLIFSKKKAVAQADIEYLEERLNDLHGDSQTLREIQKQWIDLLKDPEYIKEEEGGEKHRLGQNLQMIMADLRLATEEAYQAIRKLADRQNSGGGMLRGDRGSKPNAPLLAYLKKEE